MNQVADNMALPHVVSLDDAMARLRAFVELKQQAKKHVTLPVKICIDQNGEITGIRLQPPEIRIA